MTDQGIGRSDDLLARLDEFRRVFAMMEMDGCSSMESWQQLCNSSRLLAEARSRIAALVQEQSEEPKTQIAARRQMFGLLKATNWMEALSTAYLLIEQKETAEAECAALRAPTGTYNCPICGWNVPHSEHASVSLSARLRDRSPFCSRSWGPRE